MNFCQVYNREFTRGRYMDKEIAEEVLLAGFPQDPDAVRFIVTGLAKERPFLSIHGGAWRWLSPIINNGIVTQRSVTQICARQQRLPG
jgi:hypothetical protein